MSQTVDIPIFPLGTVLYPDGPLPLRIFEQRYVDMTKACIAADSVFGVCLILDGREAGTPAVPHAVGCTARIAEWTVPSPGLFTLLATGESVFRIQERRVQSDGLIRATVDIMPSAPPQAIDARYAGLITLFERVTEALGTERYAQTLRRDDAAWVCHRLMESLPLPLAARQRLLELQDPLEKQALLWELLKHHIPPPQA